METLNSKLPFMAPDWTLGRGIKYAAKLAVFIIVPGLHQITCKRWLFGGLLMGLYFGAIFTFTNLPYDVFANHYPTHDAARRLFRIAQYLSWILLLLDLKKLEERRLKPGLFLVLSCAAGLYFTPHHRQKDLMVIVEVKNDLCPEVCLNDIIEFNFRDFKTDNISVGDLVLMKMRIPDPYLTIVLETPYATLCEENKKSPKYFPVSALSCLKDNPESDDDKYATPYLTLGGPDPEFTMRDGRKVTDYSDLYIFGVHLKKIGNLHEYSLFGEGMTSLIGQVFLTTYTMTGINLFGLFEEPGLPFYVEQENYACPIFCKDDIIEFELAGRHDNKFKTGDHVVMQWNTSRPYVARIFDEPRKKPPCPDDYYNWLAPHSPEFLCPQGEGYNTGLYTIIGGPDTNSDMPVEIGINLVDKQEVSGLNPRKIGNIRQFDYGYDAITLFVGPQYPTLFITPTLSTVSEECLV